MEICPGEEQSLLRRRLRNAPPKALECDLQIVTPSQSTECDLDPDNLKVKPDMKEWVWKTALKISRRPSLAFSPSFLLSPICFSPVMIDYGLVSPFACINQLIATPRDTPDNSTKSSSEPTSTSSNVFTFDVVDVSHVPSSSPTRGSRRLCAIPEDRELTAIEMGMGLDSIHSQIFQFSKAEIPSAPPKSPSIAIATQCKKKSVQKKHQGHQKEQDNSKNSRWNWNTTEEKQSKANQRRPNRSHNNSGQRINSATLSKGFESKRRDGNSIFSSMVTR